MVYVFLISILRWTVDSEVDSIDTSGHVKRNSIFWLYSSSSFGYLAFYRPFKLMAATKYIVSNLPCLLQFLLRSIYPISSWFSLILSSRLGPGLFVFGFHAIFCSIKPSVLQTYPFQSFFIVFKIPTMSSYLSSSKF